MGAAAGLGRRALGNIIAMRGLVPRMTEIANAAYGRMQTTEAFTPIIIKKTFRYRNELGVLEMRGKSGF